MRGIRDISELGIGPHEGQPNSLRVVTGGALIHHDGAIVWAGKVDECPVELACQVDDWESAEGRAVLPGFVESHTHILYSGTRANEFGRRCAGASYEEIAASGGGIKYTARQVAESSIDELVEASLPRAMSLLEHGVTTLEIKSGYGLSTANELKMLRAIRLLATRTPQRILSTFLGAHTIPPTYKGNRTGYVDLVVQEMLPLVAEENLADFCDVFCEVGAFTYEDTKRILLAAQELGLKAKVHAEQLSRSGGVKAGVDVGALSVDHCEYVSDDDIHALSESDGTVATLLPGATLFLGMEQWAPGRRLIDAGVPVALSTDCNPGSSNTTNIQLMANLGCTQMGMSIFESLAAITSVGAMALDLRDEVGSLEEGKAADLCLLASPRIEDVAYQFGSNGVDRVMVGGNWIKMT